METVIERNQEMISSINKQCKICVEYMITFFDFINNTVSEYGMCMNSKCKNYFVVVELEDVDWC